MNCDFLRILFGNFRNILYIRNMKLRKFAVGCFGLMMLLLGCKEHGSRVVVTGQEEFREGDLVVRCGFGMESKIVKKMSGSK